MNLKNIITITLAIFSLISLTACISKSKESTNIEKKTPTLKEIANYRVEPYLRSIAADPDISVLPQTKSIEYSTDSICVLEFKCRGRNVLGGYSIQLAEYVIFINDDGKKYEDVFWFKKSGGIVNLAERDFNDKDPANNILQYMKSQLKYYINPPLVP